MRQTENAASPMESRADRAAHDHRARGDTVRGLTRACIVIEANQGEGGPGEPDAATEAMTVGTSFAAR
jgi:hypothetical protein